MALCLNQLLDNKRSSPFVLINDSVRFSALHLIAEFASSALRDDQPVIAILTETSPKNWIDRVSCTAGNKLNNLHIIDAYTDPFGWDKETASASGSAGSVASSCQVRNLVQMEETILANVIQKTAQQPSGCCIVVDSLHPLLLVSRRQTYQLVKALESLTTDTVKLVVGYHADIRLPGEATPPSIPTADALNRLASVIISLDALPERRNDTQEALTGFSAQPSFSYMDIMSNRVDRGGLAQIEWRKKSGKVQYATEGFYLGSRGLIVVAASELTGEEPEPEVDMDSAQPDPTANLSFNLSLTDTQRRAKESVELPFMKVQQDTGVGGVGGGGGGGVAAAAAGGNIYYQPDAGDDFDDEDPDDDLDI